MTKEQIQQALITHLGKTIKLVELAESDASAISASLVRAHANHLMTSTMNLIARIQNGSR